MLLFNIIPCTETAHPPTSTTYQVITFAVNALPAADPGFGTVSILFIYYLLREILLFLLFFEKNILVDLVESTTPKIIRKLAA